MSATVPLLSLTDLGWDDDWAAALASGTDPTVVPGRVSRVDRGISTVITTEGPIRVAAVADLSLAVGDWVTLQSPSTVTPRWTLLSILPRRCTFRRVSGGLVARDQVVAANIDAIFLVDALDGRLSVHHLERFLALALQSHAVPAIVITKADRESAEQRRQHLAEVALVVPEVAVHVVSAVTGYGMQSLAQYLNPGRTVVLVGLSGAGKSTLVNRLVGADLLKTGEVRSDGNGRHTTSHRELLAIPGGGMLIDTPGIRALSVSTATDGISQVFADLEYLATTCGFSDCSHTTDRACAIVAAVAAGEIGEDRLASWRRLQSETPAEDPRATRRRIVEDKRKKVIAKAAKHGRA